MILLDLENFGWNGTIPYICNAALILGRPCLGSYTFEPLLRPGSRDCFSGFFLREFHTWRNLSKIRSRFAASKQIRHGILGVLQQ